MYIRTKSAAAYPGAGRIARNRLDSRTFPSAMTHGQKTSGLVILGFLALAATGALILFTGHDKTQLSQPGLQNALMSAAQRGPWRDIYQARAFTPLWLTPGGPSNDAQAVMAMLAHADAALLIGDPALALSTSASELQKPARQQGLNTRRHVACQAHLLAGF